MKAKWTKLSVRTYIISLFAIPALLLLQSVSNNATVSVVFVLAHLLLLIINLIHITILLLKGIFGNKQLKIHILDALLSLLFLVVFGFFYLVLVLGGLLILLPFT